MIWDIAFQMLGIIIYIDKNYSYWVGSSVDCIKIYRNTTKVVKIRNNKIYCIMYYKDRKLHNENGPAIRTYETNYTNNSYCLNGEYLTEKEWKFKRKLIGTLIEGKY